MPQPPPVVYQQVVQPQPTNGMAVAALVLGIVGVVLSWTVWGGVILGVLGVVFGAVGLSKANQGAPNKGMAMAGLVLGSIAIVAGLLFILLFVNMVNDTHELFDQVNACIEYPENC